jgi:DNA-binding CsgD family transcriptional regulator
VEPEDLDRLATEAYLAGDDAVSADLRAQAHAAHLERGDSVAAARSAFWLGFALQDRPARRAQAGGWVARARRLLDECGTDCVEAGFLLCAQGFQLATSGKPQDALPAFQQAVEVGARFRDPTLLALARHGVARCLIRLNRTAEGFALLDEVMVGVTSGEVMPIIAGTVYCSVISACYDAFDLRRAQDWTAALDAWCAARPDMVPFRGTCMVRRAELLQIQGDWPQATTEAERAAALCEQLESSPDLGAACYQRGELLRLQGRFGEAGECYRRAALAGRQPYPGGALLRLAEGDLDAAVTAVRAMLAEVRDPRARARVLGACVAVLIAGRDLDAARGAHEELARLAAEIDAPILHATAAEAMGAVALASSDVDAALPAFRQALAVWLEADAPYEVATLRAQIGLAYRAIGDAEGARLELEAALETFERLGAAPDAARVGALIDEPALPASGPLTGREVEVLRLVATGRTNRAIASALTISEKTVARHLSNIFTKLDLPSRAAATAYAYEHKLI